MQLESKHLLPYIPHFLEGKTIQNNNVTVTGIENSLKKVNTRNLG
jgi:hypothetical protein